MTCIVAAIEPSGTVIMGGDAAGISSWDLRHSQRFCAGVHEPFTILTGGRRQLGPPGR
jgi:hypothetical protein